MRSYNFVGEDNLNAGGGIGYGAGGGGAIVLLIVVLVILFAVFRGGFGGHDGGHHMGYEGGHGRGCGGYGGSVADFEAIAQNVQRVPVEQVQLAKDFGALKEKITLGNFELSRQISETAAAAELRACMEREADFRTKISEQNAKIIALESTMYNDRRFDGINAILADIKCRMAEKVIARPLAGLPDLACSNIPGRFFNNDGCGC